MRKRSLGFCENKEDGAKKPLQKEGEGRSELKKEWTPFDDNPRGRTRSSSNRKCKENDLSACTGPYRLEEKVL